jgi:hypothetical protein
MLETRTWQSIASEQHPMTMIGMNAMTGPVWLLRAARPASPSGRRHSRSEGCPEREQVAHGRSDRHEQGPEDQHEQHEREPDDDDPERQQSIGQPAGHVDLGSRMAGHRELDAELALAPPCPDRLPLGRPGG